VTLMKSVMKLMGVFVCTSKGKVDLSKVVEKAAAFWKFWVEKNMPNRELDLSC